MADAAFFNIEGRRTPMHVAPLLLFRLPKGANEQAFLGRLVEVLCSVENFRKPFGEYVTTGKRGLPFPLYWEVDENLDFDYHVRHAALPQPGRYRELFTLVSRVHGKLLDRSRPLWEAYLIEGLQDRQFALYLKMHHAAVDGVSAIQLIEAMCSTNKKSRAQFSPLSQEVLDAFKKAKFGDKSPTAPPNQRELKTVAEILQQQLDTSNHLFGVIKGYAKTWAGAGGTLAVPWYHIPKTTINRNISGSRRFVAQTWDLPRIKQVGRAVEGTINDVVLAMCSGALRRYLINQGELPKHSLRAMVPVSLRQEGDMESANVVNFIVADLATKYEEPEDRLAVIKDSMREGKDLIREMTPKEASVYAQLTEAPLILTSLLGIAERFPALSTTISNVPGPRKQLYWNGAPMVGMYPVSAIFHGLGLNITLVSYNNKIHFGIVACRRTVPRMQRLIDYMEDALVELEEMVA
jgi:diacylglycerol O-acyltransferase